MYGFNNYPTYGYNNPYSQYYQQQMQTAAQTAQSGQTVYWIQGGEAGAKAFTMGPSQSALLMDSETSVFYIKTTDASGMPLPLRIFDYTERTAQNVPTAPQSAPIDTSLFVTRSEFEERIAAITGATTVSKTALNKTEGE